VLPNTTTLKKARNVQIVWLLSLDDTGKKWYSHPVGEVIYQEYSTSEATAWDYLRTRSRARLIDACLTEDTKQTQEVHEGRALWLRSGLDRRSSGPLWSLLHFGFFISILSATIVGMIYYLGFETELNCEDRSKESIPAKLQWLLTISAIFFVRSLYRYLFLNDILFYFRSFQMSGVNFLIFLK